MSQHKCELCGTHVKVVGKTTKHYEPLAPVASVVSGSKLVEIIEDELQTDCLKSLLDIGENPNYYEATQILARSVHALLTEGKGEEPIWPDNWKCSKHGEAWSSSDKYPTGCWECHEAFCANKMKTEMIQAWKDAQKGLV